MNSCMWAAVHLHQDQNQIQRVLRNTDVKQIHQIFTRKENQIADLQFEELVGQDGKLSWEESP